jgi:hypothetical protein
VNWNPPSGKHLRLRPAGKSTKAEKSGCAYATLARFQFTPSAM